MTGVRHLDQRRVRRDAPQRVDVVARPCREVVPDLENRDDLPLVREGRVQTAQAIRDAAPFFDRNAPHITSMNDVPHERANDADALLHKAKRPETGSSGTQCASGV